MYVPVDLPDFWFLSQQIQHADILEAVIIASVFQDPSGGDSATAQLEIRRNYKRKRPTGQQRSEHVTETHCAKYNVFLSVLSVCAVR